MRHLRVALAQINPTVGDLDGNAQKIVEYIERARAAGADLVAFPELCLTGYPPEDLLLKTGFLHQNMRRLHDIVPATRGITAIVGFVDVQDDIYNAAAIIHDGKLVGVYHKIYLPNYGVFDEDRYFQPGDAYPVYVIGGIGIGVNICEDIWYPVGPTTLQAYAGAEVIININGSPYHRGKRKFRHQMLATRAADAAVFVCYVNMVGGQDELVFDGNSMIFNAEGELVAHGSSFQEELILADLDIDGVFRERLRDPRRRKERMQLTEEQRRQARVVVSEEIVVRDRPPLPPRIPCILDDEAEIYAALVTGTRDYVRKNGFKRVYIGLSGGIDSSLVACIATDALGRDAVVGVSMPSRYSSPGSKSDAQELAENLGIEFLVIPIEQGFTAMLETLGPVFAGTQPNVAEENLQSRLRGMILMALANKFGGIVLTTGNKSELATGYATLYGDMAGGFAVIKDVPKTLVYRLARYRNTWPPRPVIPEAVLAKEPSAELRPNQRDVDTLPPYEILDPILEAYVEEDRSLGDIIEMGFDEKLVRQVIRMVDANEYKRRQAPPGVKITPKAFGRDRRLPITNRYRE
jgi:NAD+ synthase (glutamine-hydrolysing)